MLGTGDMSGVIRRKLTVHPFVNSNCKCALAIVWQMAAIANSNTQNFDFCPL
jgi:hypothetical protein